MYYVTNMHFLREITVGWAFSLAPPFFSLPPMCLNFLIIVLKYLSKRLQMFVENSLFKKVMYRN